MITTQTLNALIAFTIQNNKAALIQAMNDAGNSVAENISDDDLLQSTWNVFSSKGLDALKNVLSKVPLNKSVLSTAQQNTLIKTFGLTINPSAKCDLTHPLDCVTGVINYAGDLIGGHSTTTTTAPQTQSVPLLSKSAILWQAGGSIVAIVVLLIVFRKSL